MKISFRIIQSKFLNIQNLPRISLILFSQIFSIFGCFLSVNNSHDYITDAAKKKQLPAWIREGLNKMEREKQKKLERERMMHEKMIRDQMREEQEQEQEEEEEEEKPSEHMPVFTPFNVSFMLILKFRFPVNCCILF